jgi:hypothetical protein
MKIRFPSLTQDPRSLVLNVLIALLILLVGYLAYSLMDRTVLHRPVDTAKVGAGTTGVIQIDLLNGCGASGVATSFRDYLRARGYDVVEMRNYKSFDVDQSLVIDRTGSLVNAEKVAYALGIKKSNVIQQINPDYFVDVSVVIGKDFPSLKPSQ